MSRAVDLAKLEADLVAAGIRETDLIAARVLASHVNAALAAADAGPREKHAHVATMTMVGKAVLGQRDSGMRADLEVCACGAARAVLRVQPRWPEDGETSVTPGEWTR